MKKLDKEQEKLFDIIDNKEELMERFDSAYELFRVFELDGMLMAELYPEECELEDFGENKGKWCLPFILGPSDEDGGLSDSIFIDNYLDKLIGELNISGVKFDIGVSENAHMVYGKTESDCVESFNKLVKKLNSQGFFLL